MSANNAPVIVAYDPIAHEDFALLEIFQLLRRHGVEVPWLNPKVRRPSKADPTEEAPK